MNKKYEVGIIEYFDDLFIYYDVMWSCPPCRNARMRNTRQRRTILNRH
jgi:hypothetical protein